MLGKTVKISRSKSFRTVYRAKRNGKGTRGFPAEGGPLSGEKAGFL
ncbi:Uncharacterized protein dnm_050380 [Desulfonema magnum]|uniref:Uncharacterized protein n=1 Tax=Desulfonema magnum TaxID=45655 RepID=A0A975GQI6_9BACT|nr:Uncharacterized protein dnm_050380 [Desulfonema magnum]